MPFLVWLPFIIFSGLMSGLCDKSKPERSHANP